MFALDNENRENNNQSRVVEAKLNGIIKAVGAEGVTLKEFRVLRAIADVDAQIEAKDKEVKRTSQARALKAAAEPQLLPVPTEIEKFRQCLHSTIDDIAAAAAKTVREHITKHEVKSHGAMTHETWLEAGVAFMDDEECAFCGQPLNDRTLVDSYAEFFSDTYKGLSADVKAKRETFARYKKGEFRTQAKEILRKNEALYTYWKESCQIDPPQIDGADEAIANMESAAQLLDAVFVGKQGNLTEPTTGTGVESAITAWIEGRKEIVCLNEVLSAYATQIKELKASLEATELPRLEKELRILQTAKRRHEAETVAEIEKLQEHEAKKTRIAKEKAKEKKKRNCLPLWVDQGDGGVVGSTKD